MNKKKILLTTFISLLLSSCSKVPSSSPKSSDVTDYNSTKRLSESITAPQVGNTSTSESNEKEIKKEDKKIEVEKVIEEDDKKMEAESNENKVLIGSYTSKVYTKTAARQKNLRIVSEKLSGTILAPNQIFSYNETCGPYNKANGFGKATIFLSDGTEKQDYGGGVCQLSSTLYNAVKNANVQILERHKHSKKVYYVPNGQDATVSYGNLDFKFKNLNNYSILIEATSNADAVTVKVYKI